MLPLYLGRTMMVKLSKTSLWIALLSLVGVSALFYWQPSLDLNASAELYRQQQGFVWADAEWAMVVRHTLYWIVRVLGAICVLIILAHVLQLKMHLPRLRAVVMVLLAFSLGPGLLVNAVLKDHWGRPRPQQIQQFKGHESYQKIWVVSDACARNCSFTCGDASVVFAFWIFLAFIRNRWWRSLIFVGVGAFGLFIGLIRMAQGGHFLSDVLLSGVLVYLVVWCVAYFLTTPDKAPSSVV